MSLLQLRQDALCIKSNVFGIPISITPTLISKAIVCDKVRFLMDMYPRTSPFLDRTLDKILASENNLASVSCHLPKAKIWHQLLVSNFHTWEDMLETLTYVDNHLILFILSRTRVNLHLKIFNFLRQKMVASHERVTSLIPFRNSSFWNFILTRYYWECATWWVNGGSGYHVESEAHCNFGPSSVGYSPL